MDDLLTINVLDLEYGHDWTSIENIEDAVKFVRSILDYATDEEYERIGYIYYGPDFRNKRNEMNEMSDDDRQVRRRAQYGGGNVVDDPNDIRVYRLLELAESVHDFHNKDITIDLDTIVDSVCYMGRDYVIPVGMTIDILKDETEFMKFMCNNQQLNFRNMDGTVASVHNDSLFGKDITTVFDIKAALATTGDDYFAAYDLQSSFVDTQNTANGVVKIDVWCPKSNADNLELQPTNKQVKRQRRDGTRPQPRTTDKMKNVVHLTQIATLCAKIGEWFGHGELSFIIDATDDQLARMIFATTKVDVAICREFYPVEGPDYEYRTSTERWHYALCDVNIVDGNERYRETEYPPAELSTFATGEVFRQECPVQIEFHGTKGNYLEESTSTDVSITYARAGLYIPRISVVQSRSPFSAHAMENIIQRKLGAVPSDTDIVVELAQKRACDWGQVEHCLRARNNPYVFVSRERLASFYGVYRGANVISLKQQFHDDLDMLQYSFILSRPAGKAMSAGGYTNKQITFFIAATLATVITFMCAFGS